VATREQAGIAFEHVRGQRLEELQPGLSPRFVAGTFVPGWKTVSEPQAFALALWAHAERQRSHLRKAEVARVWNAPKQAPLSGLPTARRAAPTASSSAPEPGRRA
jgi:glycine/D-amino acid oxidase-like deaminating enzyme